MNNLENIKKYITNKHILIVVARHTDGFDENKIYYTEIINKNNIDDIFNKYKSTCDENNYRMYININSVRDAFNGSGLLNGFDKGKVIDCDSEQDLINCKEQIGIVEIFKSKKGYHVLTRDNYKSLRLKLPNLFICGLILLYCK